MSNTLAPELVDRLGYLYGRGISLDRLAGITGVHRVTLTRSLRRRGYEIRARGTRTVIPVAFISSEMWAWAAGFIDGEGCISFRRLSSGGCKGIVVSATQARSVDPLERLSKVFGGHTQVRPRPNKSTVYRWGVWSRDHSRWFLTGILPYLTVKRAEALLALEILEGTTITRQQEILALEQAYKHHREKEDVTNGN